ncbi:ornithine decarboxylase [Salmonella enterica subsp. enterica serovar Derby]|nr:ornithine decarboxylase [Salmonella enterica subsp. enterica serovar Derby]
MKSTQRVTVFPCLSRLMTKGAYRLSICRVSLVYSNIMNPVLAFYGRQLETAASHYETQLRPPFFRALVDYVNQGNSAFDCRGIRAANSSAVILPVISSWNTLAKRSSAPTYATRTWRWAIC